MRPRLALPSTGLLTALLTGMLTALLTGGLLTPLAATSATAAGSTDMTRHIAYHQWEGRADLLAGSRRGVTVSDGALVVGTPVGTRTVGSRTYELGRWVSPVQSPGFDLTQLVASWSARTPGDSFVEVEVRGTTAAGRRSSWDLLGRWAAGDRHVRRTSESGQSDDLGKVDVDTWLTSGVASWQLRVTLLRRPGTTGPSVRTVGAMASRLPSVSGVTTSKPGTALGVTLPVPRYSQMIHSGDYAQWGGGGEAWCSPTSTSMVLAYYDALPKPSAYSFVPDGHPDPWVDYAARRTYDRAYEGTGNWPFNTAYAATLTDHAFVTRLRNLREAERFIAAGIPLVASISFEKGGLSGAPISSTAGHLVVIVGFTRSGDVVVNDPAASTNATVRRTYDRGQFEDAWVPRSGGLVYVIHDAAHPLPDRGRNRNW